MSSHPANAVVVGRTGTGCAATGGAATGRTGTGCAAIGRTATGRAAIGWAAAVPIVLAVLTTSATAARAETSATVKPLLSPDRLGAKGAVTLDARFADPDAVVPAPVRRVTLSFPAGLTLKVPHLRSCSRARLLAGGPRRCPLQSVLGRGQAVVEAQLGSQTMRERTSLRLFLGPLHNLRPTVELYARGRTPFDERTVIAGSVLTASAPYGEQLVLVIPPIRTLPLEPDASIVAFSLTVGATSRARRRAQNVVHVSSRCPPGGFPVAAEFVYADGTANGADAEIPCPRRSKKEASEHANAS